MASRAIKRQVKAWTFGSYGIRRLMSFSLDLLNPAQRAAVMHMHGPLLVLAGAGSGKTRVVTQRIARLLDEKKEGAILAVTFTNKAAKEMRERLGEIVGKKSPSDVWVSTFHSFCARVLRRYGDRIGLSADFSILDTADQLAQISKAMKEIGIADGTIAPRQVIQRIGYFKNQGLESHEVSYTGDPATLVAARVYPYYERQLRYLQAVDFDDLLLLTRKLLLNNDEIKSYYQKRYRYILIDEYQDTNPIQFELVRQLVGPEQNICVVGDDDQAIYGFRGGCVENILAFDQHFSPCTVVKLEENYRSTSTILDAANAVIANNSGRKEKKLFSRLGTGEKLQVASCPDGEAEAQYVAKAISRSLENRDFAPEDIAILYRANPQSRVFEEQLRLLGVPYRVVGGQEFLERKDVKNALAFVSLIAGRDDAIAFSRVINLPARGLGAKSVERIISSAKSSGEDIITHALNGAPYAELKPDQLSTLLRFARSIHDAREKIRSMGPEGAIVDIVERSIAKAGLDEILLAEQDLVNRDKIEQNYSEVLNSLAQWCDRLVEAKQYPDLAESWLLDTDLPPLVSFLDRVLLDEEERRKEEEKKNQDDAKVQRGKVTLMTIHSSKGLEFPLVYLVGFEEGLLPHRRAIEEDAAKGAEEERRLCYVGITRAKVKCVMTFAQMRRRRREMIPRKRSRFCDELPESLYAFDEPFADKKEEGELAAAAFFKKMKEQTRKEEAPQDN